MTLYLDASVIVPLVITENASERVRAWVAQETRLFCTGHLAIGEAASAISRRRRMNLLTDAQGERALDALDAWLCSSVRVVDHDPEDIEIAAKWVRVPKPKLLMPDVVHIATCWRLRLTFATSDEDLLIIAARQGVAAIQPR